MPKPVTFILHPRSSSGQDSRAKHSLPAHAQREFSLLVCHSTLCVLIWGCGSFRLGRRRWAFLAAQAPLSYGGPASFEHHACRLESTVLPILGVVCARVFPGSPSVVRGGLLLSVGCPSEHTSAFQYPWSGRRRILAFCWRVRCRASISWRLVTHQPCPEVSLWPGLGSPACTRLCPFEIPRAPSSLYLAVLWLFLGDRKASQALPQSPFFFAWVRGFGLGCCGFVPAATGLVAPFRCSERWSSRGAVPRPTGRCRVAGSCGAVLRGPGGLLASWQLGGGRCRLLGSGRVARALGWVGVASLGRALAGLGAAGRSPVRVRCGPAWPSPGVCGAGAPGSSPSRCVGGPWRPVFRPSR